MRRTTASQVRKGFRFADGSVARGDAITWPATDSVVIPLSDGHANHHQYGAGSLPELHLKAADEVTGLFPWEQSGAVTRAADALEEQARAVWSYGEAFAADGDPRAAHRADGVATELLNIAAELRPLAGRRS